MIPDVSRTLNFQRIFNFDNAHEEKGRGVREDVHDKSSLYGHTHFEYVCVDFKEHSVFNVSSLQDLPNGRDVFNFVWSRAEDEVDIGVVGTFVDAYNEFTFLEEILTTSMKIMEY